MDKESGAALLLLCVVYGEFFICTLQSYGSLSHVFTFSSSIPIWCNNENEKD